MHDHRLYGARSAFEHLQWFLMQRKPTVLRLRNPLTLDLGQIHVTRLDSVPSWLPHQNQTWRDWPTAYGPAAGSLAFPIRTYNPSVIPLLGAARFICRKCVYVAAIRADMFHQCPGERLKRMERRKALRGVRRHPWKDPFHGTIIAVLDSNLSPLAWTWLIASPVRSLRAPDGSGNWNGSLPLNVSDGFQPSWKESAYDTRLLNVGDAAGTILCTHHVTTFGIKHLMVTADATESGGLKNLRSWSAYRTRPERIAYAQGRDQALFISGSADDEPQLFVQPWIGLVATYGRILSRSVHAQCDKQQRVCDSFVCPCGPHSEGTFAVRQIRYQHKLRLLANETESLLRKLDLGGLRLSPTTNLIRITYPPTRRGSSCPAWARGDCYCQGASYTSCSFLGIGHVHIVRTLRRTCGIPRCLGLAGFVMR